MKPRYWIALPCVATIVFSIAVVLPDTARSEDQKKEPRIARVSDIMSGIHKPAMKAVRSVSEKTPETDKDWEKVRLGAALLNESGHLLMQNKRCPDGVWAGSCADLRASTADLALAVEAKNLESARTAIDKIATSCKSCHAKHRE